MVEDRLVSIKDAAEILAISPWTIRAWVTQGKISSAKLGARRLIPESEINRLLAEAIVQRRGAKDAA
ncbi:MAG TPA: helix-turn-helix domain-containing protein [Pyrinomonadaceae bacterium]|jgi:excisionase family DNA binding protein